MGFPSPAQDYIEDAINLNVICGVRDSSRLYEFDGRIYVVDSELTPRPGDEFIYEIHGEVGLGRMRGRALITVEGEAVEGGELESMIVLGAVTYTITPLHEDSRPVI